MSPKSTVNLSIGREFGYVDVEGAAHVLGVSAKTVRRRIADGTLPACRVGRLIRIRLSDIDAAFGPVTCTKAGAA